MNFFTRLMTPKAHDLPPSADAIMGTDDEAIEALLSKLDIDNAIAAHINWKARLTNYLNGTSTEKFIPEVVCQDNVCALGQWIYQDAGERFETKPFFKMLVAWHKRFHLEASTVVSLVHANQTGAAASLLAGDYQRVSDNVIRTLKQLKKGV